MLENLQPLFEPLWIGSVKLANRFVMAPMTRGFAPGGVLDPRAVEYYQRRAQGGVGLILTEGIAPNAIGAWSTDVPSMFGATAVDAWVPVVKGVHDAGGRIMAQLWHTGLGRIRAKGHAPEKASVGASSRYAEGVSGRSASTGFEGGEALTEAGIAETISDYATAAATCKRLGFDGVEIHAAHGYLVDEFFWQETNHRTDRYNGDQWARTRFAVELVHAIKKATGSEFPLGLRYSQWKLPTLWDARLAQSPRELEELLAPLVAAGVDFFDCSTRRYWEPAFAGSPLHLAGWTRKITGKVCMAVGSVGLTGALLEGGDINAQAATSVESLPAIAAMVARGEFDLLGVGRALLCNPDWVNKIRDGREAELRAYTGDVLATLD